MGFGLVRDRQLDWIEIHLASQAHRCACLWCFQRQPDPEGSNPIKIHPWMNSSRGRESGGRPSGRSRSLGVCLQGPFLVIFLLPAAVMWTAHHHCTLPSKMAQRNCPSLQLFLPGVFTVLRKPLKEGPSQACRPDSVRAERRPKSGLQAGPFEGGTEFGTW